MRSHHNLGQRGLNKWNVIGSASLLTLLLMPLAASAKPASTSAKIDATLESCTQKMDSTLDIVGCYQQATESWDKVLNEQYRILMAGNDTKAKSELRAAMRSWIHYRDQYNSAIEAFYRQQQGTIWQITAAQAKMNVVRDKARALLQLNQSLHLEGEGEQ